MNKKFLTAVLFVALLGGSLTGCKKAAPALEDKESAGWVLHGNIKLADGTANKWNGKENELYEKSMMKAVNIDDVARVSEAVATKLREKEVKYLYMYEGAEIGTADAGWTAKFHDATDVYKANGSYVFKVAKVSYEEEDQAYSEETWIPDPKKAHVEPLTDNFFVPTWQEAKDDWGFSWADNPVVTGKAGKYTIVCAQYDAASSASVAGFGIAAILTEELEGIAPEKVINFKPAEHTLGLVGSFNGWGESAADVALTLDETDGKYKGDVTLEANAEIKVRADASWDWNWGTEALDAEASSEEVGGEGNIKVSVAGTYHVEVSFDDEGVPTIVVTLLA